MLKSLLLFVSLSAVAGCSSCKDVPTDESAKQSAAQGDTAGEGTSGPKRSAKLGDLGRRHRDNVAGGSGLITPGTVPPKLDTPVDIQARREERRAEWMAKVDTDGNGEISKDEREAARQKRIDERNREMDTDGDGKVSDAEREANRKARADELRTRIDSNGDGKVTADELGTSSFGRMNLENVDANKDGDISTDELQTALRARNEGRGGALRGSGARGRFGRFGGGGGSGTDVKTPPQPE